MRITLRLVLTIVFALALSLSLRVFVVEAVKINGESMLPTFEDGDKTFIFKLMKPKKGYPQEQPDLVKHNKTCSSNGQLTQGAGKRLLPDFLRILA